jgi:hypothetical protein
MIAKSSICELWFASWAPDGPLPERLRRNPSATRQGRHDEVGNQGGWMVGDTQPRGTEPDVTVPGGSAGTARAAGGIMLGVEEEFVLLDPRPAPLSRSARSWRGCLTARRGCSRR